MQVRSSRVVMKLTTKKWIVKWVNKHGQINKWKFESMNSLWLKIWIFFLSSANTIPATQACAAWTWLPASDVMPVQSASQDPRCRVLGSILPSQTSRWAEVVRFLFNFYCNYQQKNLVGSHLFQYDPFPTWATNAMWNVMVPMSKLGSFQLISEYLCS